MKRYICRDCRDSFTEPAYGKDMEANEPLCPECGSDRFYDVQPGEILCNYCDEPVMQGDVNVPASEDGPTYDYPMETECEECGATYADGTETGSGPTNPRYQGQAS